MWIFQFIIAYAKLDLDETFNDLLWRYYFHECPSSDRSGLILFSFSHIPRVTSRSFARYPCGPQSAHWPIDDRPVAAGWPAGSGRLASVKLIDESYSEFKLWLKHPKLLFIVSRSSHDNSRTISICKFVNLSCSINIIIKSVRSRK